MTAALFALAFLFSNNPEPAKAAKVYWFNEPVPKAETLRGRLATFEVSASGPRGTCLRLYYTGRHEEDKRHWHQSMRMRLRDAERTVRFRVAIPDDLTELRVRIDVETVGRAPVRLVRARVGASEDFEPFNPPVTPPPEGPAKMLFHAAFDDTPDAAEATGDAKPVLAKNISYGPGVKGRAVRLTAAAGSELEYGFARNVLPERGTVSLWAKGEWDGLPLMKDRTMFAFPMDDSNWGRWGSGAVWLWWYAGRLRCDLSDVEDCQRYAGVSAPCAWHHYAFAWDEKLGIRMWVDGRLRTKDYDSGSRSPTGPAYNPLEQVFYFNRPEFRTFFVGCSGGIKGATRKQFDGYIDELKIFDRMLTDDEVAREAHAFQPSRESPPDYAALFPDVPNPHLKKAKPGAPSGVPTDLELVDEVVFDRLPSDPRRFRVVGQTRVGELGGVKYLELDPRSRRGRMAYRFRLDASVPLYVFEIDYPDDRKRTTDVIVQRAKALHDDYTLNTGYATGDEYPVTGQIKTLRCLYWTSFPDVALVLMTARQDAPAAVAAVRVYRVRDGRLPEAEVNEPPQAADDWPRMAGMYWEDPAIGYDFGTLESKGGTPEDTEKVIDRTIALMKFTGQNFFAYPGSWYEGLIGAPDTDYMPRPHAPDFLSAWYVKFDRAGMYFMPTLNVHDMPLASGVVTWDSARDGSLHRTPVTILSNGLPPGNGTHGTPPAFCFYHPDVQDNIRRQIRALVDQGVAHKSFKGVALHLTLHPFLHWGDDSAGYNDYCIDGFSRDTGVTVPVDRADPMRGKAYFEWLKAHAWDKWIQWRCDKVTEFYAGVAAEMRARRSDLKIWFNSSGAMNWWGLAFRHPKWGTPEWVEYQARAMGLDPAGITARIPNAIVGQCFVPADYRWRYGDKPQNKDASYQRDVDSTQGLWWSLGASSWPFVHQHDRYFEDAIGAKAKGDDRLSGDWFDEIPWRVSVINPSGANALRAFAAPLRYGDVLGITKGGFLIGTYGIEDVITPWLQAFRALPPVKMTDVPSPGENIVMRRADWRGRTYFYLVNVSEKPAEAVVSFPAGAVDLVSGWRPSGGGAAKVRVALGPWELRSFAAQAASGTNGK